MKNFGWFKSKLRLGGSAAFRARGDLVEGRARLTEEAVLARREIASAYFKVLPELSTLLRDLGVLQGELGFRDPVLDPTLPQGSLPPRHEVRLSDHLDTHPIVASVSLAKTST